MFEFDRDVFTAELRAIAMKRFLSTACLICGVEDDDDLDEMIARDNFLNFTKMPHVAICTNCAACIANAFNYRLGGAEILTPGEYGMPTSARTAGKSRAPISSGKRKRVMERDEYRCRHCKTHIDLTIDHILAVANGGTDDEDNLQVLCRPCNCRKGTKPNDECERAAA